MAAQAEVYAQKMQEFEPQVVRRACEEWAAAETKWPKLAELLGACRNLSSTASKAEIPVDPMSVALNEAMGFLRSEILREFYKLGVSDPAAQRGTLTEMAEWWSRTRPANGWQTEVERRCCVNAVESWAEEKFGLEPWPKLAEVDPSTMRQRDITPLVKALTRRVEIPA